MAVNPLSDPEWAENVTDTIVSTVDKVRDRTTTPIVMAARGLVFGLLSAILGAFILIVALVAAQRGLVSLIEWPLDHDSAVWVSYLVLGAVLLVIGSVCMSKRQSHEGV